MSTRISPIVNIFEKDLSYIPQAIQEIPYMYVNLFERGKAFVPTYINTYDDYVSQFGAPSSTYKTGYAIQSRMNNNGNVAIVRILGQTGYVASNAYALTSGNTLLGYIRTNMIPTVASGGAISAFTLSITGGGSVAIFNNLSLLSTDTSNYIENVISTVPNNQSTSANNFTLKNAGVTGRIYVSNLYQYYIDTLSSSASIGIVSVPSASSFLTNYTNSKSTTVVSNIYNGQVYDLFTVNTISDGDTSTQYKIAITNINTTSGRFNLIVRDISDTDRSQVILEQWNDLSLDPTDDNFIGSVIGNSVITTNSDGSITELGDYPNKSKYIYLTGVNTVLPNGLTISPGGFKGYIGAISGANSEPSLPIKRNQYDSTGTVNSKVAFGVDFTKNNIPDFLAIKPISMTLGSTTAYKGFLLYEGIENTSLSAKFYGTSTGSYNSVAYNSSTYISATASYNALDNFVFAVAGGFDGFDEEISTTNKLKFYYQNSGGNIIPTTNVLNSIGYADFTLAIKTIADVDYADFKLLFTPGIYQAEAINYTLAMVEDRHDALYIPDLVSATGDMNTLLSLINNYDSSYGAVYYPGIKQKDLTTNVYNWLDTSILMSEVFSYNDNVAQPWWAAAGLNRGRLDSAYIAFKKLKLADRTLLYNNRINPIATFSSNGQQTITVLGNATLQQSRSVLSDINIRRMLIEAEKFVASIGMKLLFEPIDQDLFDTFRRMTTPYFDTVKSLKGLVQYSIIMDSTTTSPADIDLNQVNGSILIKPTKAAEVINIGFMITKQAAIFTQ
jgi:hypothetical protein